MDKSLMFNLLVSQFDCEYNFEYKKLSEEEKNVWILLMNV